MPDADVVLAERYQWASVVWLHRGIPGATYEAGGYVGSALRPSALDAPVAGLLGEARTVSLVWAERPPPTALQRDWPALCSVSTLFARGPVGPPPVTHVEVRARRVEDCLEHAP